MSEDIRPGQLRAARAFIGWTREQLAEAAGTTTRTLARLEAGEARPRTSTAEAIRRALEAAGVEFIDDEAAPGVRLRAQRHLTVEEGGTDKAEPADATETDPPHREGR